MRSDAAIRRHWELVMCAFSFCWWAYGRLPTDEVAETGNDPSAEWAQRGEATPSILAGGLKGSKGVAGPLRNAESMLEAFSEMPPAAGTSSAA